MERPRFPSFSFEPPSPAPYNVLLRLLLYGRIPFTLRCNKTGNGRGQRAAARKMERPDADGPLALRGKVKNGGLFRIEEIRNWRFEEFVEMRGELWKVSIENGGFVLD